MKLDLSHIEHVAKLASLSLAPGEAEAMTKELGDILKYVEELSSVDTSSVGLQDARASAQLGPTAWRRDEETPGLSHDEALAQAPRQADGGFAVPGFVEGGS
jgi:aspartyl-tRNA(Asn)/glutamyl-tRNA(Gln) amidotransferase subunit C